jgi:hypothetical protein
MIYKAIGKLVVKAVAVFVRLRYGRQLRFAAGFVAVAVAIGAYLASREVTEG